MILFENLFKLRQLPSATSKQCFEQPATSFLVCSLIFIEYEMRKQKDCHKPLFF
ncbi:BOX element [Streptococcus mitis]|uniref:BOX element n=1 Tax=Streptococcus mitis TaxID=28037 RepID=A0A139PUB7_STRMT|nr:BOX element [Streptococcus mitis]